MSKARDLSDFISVATVDASEIADLAITHAKLHTDMNLSSKTVTLPSAITNTITNKLPLAGGTLTGALTVNATLTNSVTTGRAGYFASSNPNNTNKHIAIFRDNLTQSGTDGIGTIGITSGPGQDVYLGKRYVAAGGGSTFAAIRASNATEHLTINMDNGNVGIGATSPLSNLHISQTANSGNNYRHGQIIVGNAAANSGVAVAYNGISSGRTSITALNNSGGANAQLSLGFGAVTSAGAPTTNVMTLNQSGNVGIGTDAPSVKLHVVGGADANLYLKSDSARSGAFLMKPGTDTVMGSLLQLADESYRLGTAGHYHIQMYQNGQTLINPDGDSVKIGGGGSVDSVNTQFNMEFPATGGISIGAGYTFSNMYGDASGNLFLKANAYPANTGSSSRVELRAANSGGGASSPLVWYDNGQLGLNNLTPEYAIDINGNNFNRSSIRMVRTDGGQNNDTAVIFKRNAGTASNYTLGGLWFGNSNYDSGDNAYALIRARTQDVGSSGKLQFITSNGAVSNTTPAKLTINHGGDFLIGGQFNYHVISGFSAPNSAFQYDFYRDTYGIPMKITCAISHWNGGYMSFTEGMYWGYNTVMSSSVHHVYNGGNGSWTISFPTSNIVRVRMNGDASYNYASGWYIKLEGNLRRTYTSS